MENRAGILLARSMATNSTLMPIESVFPDTMISEAAKDVDGVTIAHSSNTRIYDRRAKLKSSE